MGISVVLIDKSEIVQKMFSHCLYYFSAHISRFDNWDEYKAAGQETKPDIVFVDWEVKREAKALIFTVIEEMKSIPVILLYRSPYESEIKGIPSDQIPHKLLKPFDPKTLREQCMTLIPQIKESKIHPFLKFPKEKAPEQNQSLNEKGIDPSVQNPDTLTKADNKENIHFPLLNEKSKSIQDSLENKSSQKQSPLIPLENKEKDISPQQIQTVKKSEEQDAQLKPATDKPATSAIQKTGIADHLKKETQKQTQLEDAPLSIQKIMDSASKEQPIKQDIQKNSSSAFSQNQDLEEVTIIKTGKKIIKDYLEKEKVKQTGMKEKEQSSPAVKAPIDQNEAILTSKNIELNEKDILKVLNKYKDSLEFQKIMEKALGEHITETVTKILQYDKTAPLIEKSLNNFKESRSFKSLVESEIKTYIKKQLPLIIKAIVEEEIKKILGD